MKFNACISEELKEYLEEEYKEYIKHTPMAKKEQRRELEREFKSANIRV